eukprot:SAG22_NODE_7499_length_734_cov_1.248819_1_plen_229_part_00
MFEFSYYPWNSGGGWADDRTGTVRPDPKERNKGVLPACAQRRSTFPNTSLCSVCCRPSSSGDTVCASSGLRLSRLHQVAMDPRPALRRLPPAPAAAAAVVVVVVVVAAPRFFGLILPVLLAVEPRPNHPLRFLPVFLAAGCRGSLPPSGSSPRPLPPALVAHQSCLRCYMQAAACLRGWPSLAWARPNESAKLLRKGRAPAKQRWPRRQSRQRASGRRRARSWRPSGG